MNLSGTRGVSPVLRVRVPDELLDKADAKAERTGNNIPDVVRKLLWEWVDADNSAP